MADNILPTFVTVPEVAAVLRTSRKAAYTMIARGQIPGVVRIGRRVLVRQDDLLDWLNRNRTSSPKESRR
jgi:excisionase family DNA binding protein